MTTISYVSSASGNGTTLAMPSHQAGDLLLMAAYKDSVNTIQAAAAGWLSLNTGNGANSNMLNLFWKIAQSASETSGTWTSATQLACAVYRGTTQIAPGGFRQVATITNLTVSWSAFGVGTTSPVARQNDDTWFIGIIGYRTNDVDCEVAPTGMTHRTNIKGASTGQLSIHDSNGDIAPWSNTNQTFSTGVAANSMLTIIELCDTGYASAGAGGGGPLISGRLVR